MNRSTLVEKVAQESGCPVETVEHVMNCLFEVITVTLCNGESVSLRKFGKLDLRLRRAMDKPNPKTGDDMHIPERISVTLLPSDLLKERLNRH